MSNSEMDIRNVYSFNNKLEEIETEGTKYPDEFDVIIGHIEDILVDENFHILIENFMEKHWKTFDNTEENKLEYTHIFEEYTDIIENYINLYLTSRIPTFSMELFFGELQKRKGDLDGEIFDILFTMSDFLKFKEIILDFRNVKEGLVANLNLDSCITSLHSFENK